ncbi:MAG: hypothetical protein FJX46_14130 [Alphaproteobacteria bacterium]|nr:hypothetical protein [Alphaproteobacteria bacterium]
MTRSGIGRVTPVIPAWRVAAEGVGVLYARHGARGAMPDCGTDAGLALAALRQGFAGIVFRGRPGIARKLSAIARRLGARVIARGRPRAVISVRPQTRTS